MSEKRLVARSYLTEPN